MVQPIYLDYNGTTPIDPEVIEAMRPFLENDFGNPSSSHWYGIKPKKAVEWAKGTLRFSVGKMTTEAEIDKAIRVVAEAVKKLRSVC